MSLWALGRQPARCTTSPALAHSSKAGDRAWVGLTQGSRAALEVSAQGAGKR